MKNILDIRNCYGCGVCSASCPRSIISIKLNSDGFYAPCIEEPDSCINCGICTDVCAFIHKDIALNDVHINSWAAWSNDDLVRKKCSSGGIGFEIGKHLINNGYKVVGCRYNVDDQRAEHFIASSVKDLVQTIGSKYIQSYTETAFKNIRKSDNNYLVIGTPCQIDSFRRMTQKFKCEGNFILMDFYCHCVPSMHAWKSYLKFVETKVGKVTYASWRNKFEYGWHDSWLMGLDGDRQSSPVNWNNSYSSLIQERKTHFQSRMSEGDLFYRLFLGDLALGPQCQFQCKYKMDKSSADIRIGDLWGKTYQNNQAGVSALVTFTEKGLNLVKSLEGATLVEHPFEVVAEGQMKSNAKAKEMKPVVMFLLRNKISVGSLAFKAVIFMQRVINRLRII